MQASPILGVLYGRRNPGASAVAPRMTRDYNRNQDQDLAQGPEGVEATFS